MAEGNGDFVRISNREIYDAVRELQKTTGRMDDRMNDILKKNTEYNKRIRSLEIKVYGVLAGTGGLFLTAITVIFRGKGVAV